MFDDVNLTPEEEALLEKARALLGHAEDHFANDARFIGLELPLAVAVAMAAVIHEAEGLAVPRWQALQAMASAAKNMAGNPVELVIYDHEAGEEYRYQGTGAPVVRPLDPGSARPQ